MTFIPNPASRGDDSSSLSDQSTASLSLEPSGVVVANENEDRLYETELNTAASTLSQLAVKLAIEEIEKEIMEEQVRLEEEEKAKLLAENSERKSETQSEPEVGKEPEIAEEITDKINVANATLITRDITVSEKIVKKPSLRYARNPGCYF